MKYTVESEYKNPDRYIAILKSEVDYAWKQCRDECAEAERLQGREVVNYVDTVDRTFGVNTHELCGVKPGTEVVVVGRVRDTSADLSSSEITIDHITISVREKSNG